MTSLVNLVSTCPLADGYDYPFQIDYATAWGHLIESVKAVVTYRKDIRLALEYQPHEPHARIMLSNVGSLLYVCSEIGADNLGANFDIGHSFAAHETPAESATLLSEQGRLFYVHTNDNTGDGGDWDMISGSVHFWHWLELLLVLDQSGYGGWLGGDITPKHMGPVEAFDTNFRMIECLKLLLRRLGPDKIRDLVQKEGNTPETYNYLIDNLIR